MASFSVNTNNGSYGPLQQGFVFELQDGYSVLTGRNNAGKSALLQLLFSRAFQHELIGRDAVAYIPSHRGYVAASTETGGATFRQYNESLASQILNQPLQYAQVVGPSVGDLPRLLINHHDFRRQTTLLDQFLVTLGFSELVLRDAQQAHFDDVAVVMQGSGLRGLFPILCALTDNRLQIILIDEPENSLEPGLQKALRDLLVARAASVKVVVATHSHLFLNRGSNELGLNHIVTREAGQTAVSRVATKDELLAITFALLGSNTEDLFFPGNYLIVEGASDQAIIERILEIMKTPITKLKVVAATGITKAANRLASIENAIIPLVVHDSPYAGKVGVLIDEPTKLETAGVDELRRNIGERLVTIPAASLEEYLPARLFTKAGRSKEQDLADLAAHRSAGHLKAMRELKRDISKQIAAVLEEQDFPEINVIVGAVAHAVARA